MLYALVLVVTTVTVEPMATVALGYGGDPYAGRPFVSTQPVTQTSQQIVGYFRTERGCLAASLKRSDRWPDFAPGQSVTGLCVQVEIPAGTAVIGG